MAEINKPLLIITGPTASGKTSLAEKIAYDLNGEIISADSRSVYRDIEIGTARAFNSSEIEYHLTGIVDIGSYCTTRDLILLARSCVEDIIERDKLPILCGGSIHFVDRMINGIRPGPDPDPELRKRLRDMEESEGRGSLHLYLRRLDRELSESVHPNNINRIVRYIEKCTLKDSGERIEPFRRNWKGFFIDRSIPSLRKRIGERTERMFDAGWIDEVKELIHSGKDPYSPGFDSTGYCHVFDLIYGRINETTCREKITNETVELARRQRKWKKRLPEMDVIDLDRIPEENAIITISDSIQQVGVFGE